MRTSTLLGGLVGAVLTVTLTACGTATTGSAAPADGSRADPSAAAGPGASGDKDQQITPGGIAVVVREHLGRDAVQQFVTFEQEPGSVAVMIRLRRATAAENFAVSVYSPDDTGEAFGEAGTCPSMRHQRAFGDSRCRTLDSGRTVMTSENSEGFSDDNAHGMVVFGTAVTPDSGTAMAMYESYDDSPVIRAADLDRLLADPRLSWLTDPALNEAGKDVTLRVLRG